MTETGRMRKSHPSGISRQQFETRGACWKREADEDLVKGVDLYEVFCARLYVLKSGRQCLHFCLEDF